MTETYDDQLRTLREEIQHHGARPTAIDSIISKMLADNREVISQDLLLLLSDDSEYDEGMFSLIHAAERVDDQKYVHSLLSVFSIITRSSPRWTSILMMRVLNSRSTQLELIAQLRTASKSIKVDIDDICLRISSADPEFLAKTIPVNLAAR